MAQLGGNFSADGDTMETRDVLPAGDYKAAIVKSEVKDAKKQGNRYINLEFEVMDGEMQGRRFWAILNLWNSNAQAVEIAERELRSIAQACGKLSVSDTEELHGVPMLVKLTVKDDAQYGPQNNIKGYKSASTTAPAQQQGSGGTSGGAPWRSNAA